MVETSLDGLEGLSQRQGQDGLSHGRADKSLRSDGRDCIEVTASNDPGQRRSRITRKRHQDFGARLLEAIETKEDGRRPTSDDAARMTENCGSESLFPRWR
jgi:hypothetical protein